MTREEVIEAVAVQLSKKWRFTVYIGPPEKCLGMRELAADAINAYLEVTEGLGRAAAKQARDGL